MTPTVGRSHGIHAEPTTFGLKLAYAYAEFARGRERLVAARKEVATCAISGAVGTFAQVDPRVEAHVAKAMGLAVEPISTQIIPRDRHAMYFATLGVIASSIERLATEIRHLQRTEVLEAEEFFSEKQKGSSAMPHKRNPVLSENITGLARMVRAYALPAMENVALWHERDISHSSVERMIGPDATVTLDFALARLAGLIDKLVVYPDTMQKNLDKLGGLIHSQRVLIALTQKGVAREDAYRLVQRNAMKVWDGEKRFPGAAQGRQGRARQAQRQGDRGQFRPRPPFQARRYHLQARVRRRLTPCAMPPRPSWSSIPASAGSRCSARSPRRAPTRAYVYVADDAGFPYGNQPEGRADRAHPRRRRQGDCGTRARSGGGGLQHRLDDGARRIARALFRCPSSAPCRRSSRPARSRRASASRCWARKPPSAANIPAR